jgi:hypothetical protein
MLPEELLALRKCYRMGQRFSNVGQPYARRRNQLKKDVSNRLPDNLQIVFEEQVVACMDGAGQRVFNGNNPELSLTARDGIENIFESGTREKFAGSKTKIDTRVLAVGTARTLICSVVLGLSRCHP